MSFICGAQYNITFFIFFPFFIFTFCFMCGEQVTKDSHSILKILEIIDRLYSSMSLGFYIPFESVCVCVNSDLPRVPAS